MTTNYKKRIKRRTTPYQEVYILVCNEIREKLKKNPNITPEEYEKAFVKEILIMEKNQLNNLSPQKRKISECYS